MKQTVKRAKSKSIETERGMLRNRVATFYRRFNNADWDGRFALIDPQLTQSGKVRIGEYTERMQTFKDVYRTVNLWSTKLNLYLDASPKQFDKRPFAYVYVFWKDDAHGIHMFRERRIKENGHWFTRVVGLVPNQQAVGSVRV